MNCRGCKRGLAGHEEATAPCRNCQQNTGTQKEEEETVENTHFSLATHRSTNMGIVIRIRSLAETKAINGGHSLIVI